jgi:hypothetical protein
MFVALFVLCFASLAMAQGSSDYKPGEFGFGYSANAVDTQGAFSASGSNDRDWFHGFYVNGAYNFTRYVGLQGEVSHHRKTTDFTSSTGVASKIKGNLTNFVGGIKIQDNATETKVRPFVRALIGGAHASGDFTVGTVRGSDSDTGFAGVFGGGLGFRVNNHWDVDVSADWNPTHFGNNSTSNGWDNNFRLGVGLKFRGGSK